MLQPFLRQSRQRPLYSSAAVLSAAAAEAYVLLLLLMQVGQALSDVQRAWQHITAGDYHAAGAAAAAARAAAEAAFLHPAVLAQLNFPESHKLGVYMPLFLPVSVPLLQGLLLQLRQYVKRRREFIAGLPAG